VGYVRCGFSEFDSFIALGILNRMRPSSLSFSSYISGVARSSVAR
jgi:hypothetical protein